MPPRIAGKRGLLPEHIAALLSAMSRRKAPVIPIRAVTTPDFLEHDTAYTWFPALKRPLTMLGNNTVGDCVVVMILNWIRIWCGANGIDYEPTTDEALAIYSAITGYNPNAPLAPDGQNPTDAGTDPLAAIEYARKTGFDGHFVRAWLQIEPHDINHICAAIQKLGGVGAAIILPEDAEAQFEAGKPWTISSYAALKNTVGGHGVYIGAFDKFGPVCATWAHEQPMSWNFLWGTGMTILAAVGDDFLRDGKAPNGLNTQAILAYMAKVAN